MPRTNYLNVKLSTQEREKFETAAKDQGLSLGEYARQAMMIKFMMDEISKSYKGGRLVKIS